MMSKIELLFLLPVRETLANRVICKLTYVEEGKGYFSLSMFSVLPCAIA